MNFSADWFSHNVPFWINTFKAAGWNPQETSTIVEIGSFEGRSTIWSCKNLLHNADSRIYCIDTFEGSVEHSNMQKSNILARFQSNIQSAGMEEKVIVRRGASWLELARLAAEGVRPDFVYVDGSHQAPDVMSDAVLSFNMLKEGGLMIFDDYHWSIEPHGQEDILNSPKLAIDMFISLYRRKAQLFAQSRNQIALRKTSSTLSHGLI